MSLRNDQVHEPSLKSSEELNKIFMPVPFKIDWHLFRLIEQIMEAKSNMEDGEVARLNRLAIDYLQHRDQVNYDSARHSINRTIKLLELK